MSDIRINQLVLENFKCHRFLKLDFNGKNAGIFGDNAAGKTSVYDGLCWLLFGKDSAGNGEKNIDIKPLGPDGEVADHKAITSVEVVFDVDGEEIVLKRTYREIWATRRGCAQEVYDGNTSEYFVDGVPQKKFAYDARIKELVPEELFRMLTSVSQFARDLKWQDRREILFRMADIGSDKEIMGSVEQFGPLLESMGRLSLEDYKKKLLSERKGLTGIRNETPARLDEMSKTVRDMEGIDFAGIRAQLEALEGQRVELNSQLIALDNVNAAAQKRLEIREVQLGREQLEGRNRAFRDSQKAEGPDASQLQTELRTIEGRMERARETMEREKRDLERLEKQIEGSREQWISVKGETFTGGKCPTCGQTLPFEQLKKATEQFEQKQARQLAQIEQMAQTLIETRKGKEHRIGELENTIREYQAQAEVLRNQVEEAKTRVTAIRDMEGYGEQMAAIDGRLKNLEQELQELVGGKQAVRTGVARELAEVNGEIRNCQELIAKESVLTYTRERIEQLRQEAQNAAAALEAIEKMLWLMEEYSRYKAKFVEDSINGLFRLARFRLFREQANGGLEDRCDVVYDGVPYMGLNNGMKINVGIDIINALSRFYGVTVPLFVDNAESVTRLEECEAQVIRLVVSEEDKELRLKHEDQGSGKA